MNTTTTCKWAQSLFNAINSNAKITGVNIKEFTYGGRIDFVVEGSEYPKLGYQFSTMLKDLVVNRINKILAEGGQCYLLRISGLSFTDEEGSKIMYGKHILIPTKSVDGSISIEALYKAKDNITSVVTMLQSEARRVLSDAELAQVPWCVPDISSILDKFADLLK